MSHYDCKNCGVFGGIDWGYCKACTPQEYFDLKEALWKVEWEALSRAKKHYYPLITAMTTLNAIELGRDKIAARIRELEARKG